MSGRVIGNYQLLEKAGEGGMGQVYRALDTMLEREVAIKMLHRSLTQDESRLERFRVEAVLLAKLHQENIATLYSFFEHAGDYYMVMEYVDGETFEALIKRTGPLPMRKALQLFHQSLAGFAHAHARGIIHRDIKPSNLIVNSAGIVKITDFGVARAIGDARMTKAGRLIGTLEYMSPEQVKGQEQDERSDIYSLGILLYEMLTGRVPFSCPSEYEVMRSHLEITPERPCSLLSDIPEEVERVVLRMLEKNPEQRYQNIDELMQATERVIAALPKESAITPSRSRSAQTKAATPAAALSVMPQPSENTTQGIPQDALPPDATAGEGHRSSIFPALKWGKKPWAFAIAGIGLLAIASIGVVGMMHGRWGHFPSATSRATSSRSHSSGASSNPEASATAARTKEIRRFREEIPYQKVTREALSLMKGQTRVATQGQPGVRETIVEVTLFHGKEESRTTIGQQVLSNPVTEVTLVGTAQPAASPRKKTHTTSSPPTHQPAYDPLSEY